MTGPTPGTGTLAPRAAGASPGTDGGRLRWALADTLTLTWRNLLAYSRNPEAVFFSSIQPVMFVLLFRYVFGGAIGAALHGITYPDYLLPGIYVQTLTFGAISTSIGLAEDLQKGLIERFRALPMARSAVLGGRAAADSCRNLVVAVVVTAVGCAVGFRIHTNVLAFLGGVLLVLLFAHTLSWGMACIGLSAPNSETAQVMSFPLLFPLTFASSAFVPVQSMPTWLRGFANNQPVSQVIDGARALMEGGQTASHVEPALAWCLGLLIVFAPLAVRQYRRAR